MTPDQFDAWRVMPRVLLTAYYVFFAFAFWGLCDWVMAYNFDALESEVVALAIVGFPAAVLGVLSGVLASLTKNYFNTPGTNGG